MLTPAEADRAYADARRRQSLPESVGEETLARLTDLFRERR